MRCIISGVHPHVYDELLEVQDLKLCSIFNPLEECRSCNGSHVLHQLFHTLKVMFYCLSYSVYPGREIGSSSARSKTICQVREVM